MACAFAPIVRGTPRLCSLGDFHLPIGGVAVEQERPDYCQIFKVPLGVAAGEIADWMHCSAFEDKMSM